MVALLQPSISTQPSRRTAARTSAGSRHLRVVPEPASAPLSIRELAAGIERSVVGFAVVAVMLVGGALAVRVSQGAPPAEGLATASATASVGSVEAVKAGEATLLVAPGDSLWAIAGRIVGDNADRRPVVQQLAERNGGSAVFAGQQLIIPVTLAEEAALG